MPNSNEIPLLHIYGQHQWHDEAYIVANTDGLIGLRNAIQEALDKGKASNEAFANDGEGYVVKVTLNNDEWLGEFWTKLAVPYSDEVAEEKREDAVWPWRLNKRIRR